MSEKLWDKGYEVDRLIEEFTVGSDYIVDMKLIEYDIKASLVHAEMLKRMSYLSEDEFEEIKDALERLLVLVRDGKFKISRQEEDCHTAIESFLVQQIGDAGKKIHTARSRNDQVLTALRLMYKEELGIIRGLIVKLQDAVKRFSGNYGDIRFAGFTHTRKAMPTDFRTFGMALHDALSDDLVLLDTIYKIIDQSPLGTGAGYGVPIEIDREFTSQRLGFAKVQENPIYAQNSRGKFDFMVMHVLSQVSYDLNRFASDIILFSLPDVGYLILPKELCTGSSIMPQKFNPDPLELVRAYHHRIVAHMLEVVSMSSNLISGYHRDFQLLKEVVIDGFEITKQMLRVMKLVFERLKVNEDMCNRGITDEVLATQRVYELVLAGVPFRDAYKKIAEKYSEGR